jgi:hypothetical protein
MGQEKMSHLVLRVIYSESAADSSLSPGIALPRHPQHFVVAGGSRDGVSRWVLSLTGNVLHHEIERNLEASVDHLTADEEGNYIASFERKSIVIRDEYLSVCNVFRCNKEIPTDGQFVYSESIAGSTRPHYFICCFESGRVAVGWMLLIVCSASTF